jgi:chemotaxis protein methyltransferase CheR
MNGSELDLDGLTEKIRLDRGFNGQFYKDKCVRRRIEMRMRARGVGGLAEYGALLDTDPVEYERLIDNLTVNVTKFFRDFRAWEAIRRHVVPDLLRLAAEGPIRIWSAGCASGEEAYSISILMREAAAEAGTSSDLRGMRITGTDIHGPSLDVGRRAEYREHSFDETPSDIRGRWFTASPPFRLHDDARNGVAFELVDLTTAPPLPSQALILCRNVAIYFSRAVQERLFHAFHDALLPGGFLVLGRTETLVGPARGLFAPVSVADRIYRK